MENLIASFVFFLSFAIQDADSTLKIAPALCPTPADLAAGEDADHIYRPNPYPQNPTARVDLSPRITAPSTVLFERPVGEFGAEPGQAAGGPFIGLAYDLRRRRLRIAGETASIGLAPGAAQDATKGCPSSGGGERLPKP